MDVRPELAVQMACQSCPSLIRHFHSSQASDLGLACPASGSASIWAQSRTTTIADTVALQDIRSISIGTLHAHCK